MTREEIQKDALRATVNKQQCGLGLATGVGKTLVGLKFLERENSPLKDVLIVAPKKSIMDTWKTEAKKFNLGHVLSNAKYITYLSLHKLNPNDYDIVVLDECHSLLYSHEPFLSAFRGKVLGLSGTPPRHPKSEKGVMVNKYCPIVYEYVTDDAVGDEILNDYQIIVHEVTMSGKSDYLVKAGKKEFYTSEVKNYAYWTTRLENSDRQKELQINRVMRMKAMMDYPSKEKYAKILAASIKSKCIIFANTQEQADRLCTHSYHSKNPESEDNLEMFKNGSIDKLSCVLQLSEGVNIPNLKQCIILHAYGNERKASQRIGRCLRLSPEETAIVHILCFKNTVDETWVKTALEGFNEEKITWKNYNIRLD